MVSVGTAGLFWGAVLLPHLPFDAATGGDMANVRDGTERAEMIGKSVCRFWLSAVAYALAQSCIVQDASRAYLWHGGGHVQTSAAGDQSFSAASLRLLQAGRL
jgi:hypothetical protein